MILRKSFERGNTTTNWLKSLHTFSFANYYDPQFMHFASLRVINEDWIEPSKGFGMHSHRDMEIITYVVTGSLAHHDSMGTGSSIYPGEIQRMSAGSGIQHSEHNPSANEALHLLQIWIMPQQYGLTPSYEQEKISTEQNKLILIAAPDKQPGAVIIHQNAKLYVAYLTQDATIDYSLPDQHIAWLQLIKGKITVNGQTLEAGDGAGIDDNKIAIKCLDMAEFLLFDLES